MSDIATVSPSHASIKRMRRLSRSRRERADTGLFVIEGSTLVLEALRNGVEFEDLVVEQPVADEVLDESRRRGVALRALPAGALEKVVSTASPQPVAAVVRQRAVGVVDGLRHAGTMAFVLVGIGDPGNAGTLVRSAEAVGAGAVLFCDGSVDPFNPKCVRAAASATFRVEVVPDADAADVLRRAGDLQSSGADGPFTRIGTVARGGAPPEDIDLTRPFALVLGNEAHGLPAALDALIDVWCSIPMAQGTESLNVAVAGAAIGFEALRQRRAAARA